MEKNENNHQMLMKRGKSPRQRHKEHSCLGDGQSCSHGEEGPFRQGETVRSMCVCVCVWVCVGGGGIAEAQGKDSFNKRIIITRFLPGQIDVMPRHQY
jgi:hypothetical protein